MKKLMLSCALLMLTAACSRPDAEQRYQAYLHAVKSSASVTEVEPYLSQRGKEKLQQYVHNGVKQGWLADEQAGYRQMLDMTRQVANCIEHGELIGKEESDSKVVLRFAAIDHCRDEQAITLSVEMVYEDAWVHDHTSFHSN